VGGRKGECREGDIWREEEREKGKKGGKEERGHVRTVKR
jgi:hypothetical protein